jgi:hypothetical protein
MDKSGSKLKLSEAKEPFEIPIKPAGPGKIAGAAVPMPFFLVLVPASQFSSDG